MATRLSMLSPRVLSAGPHHCPDAQQASLCHVACTQTPHLTGISCDNRKAQSFKRSQPHSCRAVSDDKQYDWVARYESVIRVVPLGIGLVGTVGVLLNRFLSQNLGAAGDAGSQSRADVLATALAAVLLLTGLQWSSVKAGRPPQVEPSGCQDCCYFADELSDEAKAELQWAWESFSGITTCRSLVALYRGRCVAHLGLINAAARPGDAQLGRMAEQVMRDGRANNLANLARYPGAVEFRQYLPSNTSSAVIQPLGDEGVLVAGSDTQRGFGPLDQVWLASLAQKLDTSLGDCVRISEPVAQQTS